MRKQITDLRQEITPVISVRGGIASPNTNLTVRRCIAKRFTCDSSGTSNLSLADFGSFQYSNTFIRRIDVMVEPLHYLIVKFAPDVVMNTFNAQKDIERLLIARADYNQVAFDVPDAKAEPVTSTSVNTKFITLTGSPSTTFFVKVHYTTTIDLSL